MEEQYFITRCTEDGTSISQPMSREQLLLCINRSEDADDDEEATYCNEAGITGRNDILAYIPESCKGYWEGVRETAIVIIRGTIVKPKAKGRGGRTVYTLDDK